MLVSKNTRIGLPPDDKPKICVIPDANPRRQSVEYRLDWVPNAKFRVGYVHFFFVCVDSIRVGSRCSVEYELKSGQFCNLALINTRQ